MYRIGLGYDNHRFGKKADFFILGGIKIPFSKGIVAHSDGDALYHALIDALLGASAKGDIGQHFPDNDPQYKNIDSEILLKKTLVLINDYEVVNIDATIILEKPKLKEYLKKIKEKLKVILGDIPINLKAKTKEGQDSVGRGESVEVQVACLLKEKLKKKLN